MIENFKECIILIFIINALKSGWKVQIKNNKYEFTKSLLNIGHNNIDNNFLSMFIKQNISI
jgi:hypothetical protein